MNIPQRIHKAVNCAAEVPLYAIQEGEYDVVSAGSLLNRTKILQAHLPPEVTETDAFRLLGKAITLFQTKYGKSNLTLWRMDQLDETDLFKLLSYPYGGVEKW
jgi:hypothetical protein